ncbi:hypothetical protein GCM10027167_71410 [Nocardia heshunensis]
MSTDMTVDGSITPDPFFPDPPDSTTVASDPSRLIPRSPTPVGLLNRGITELPPAVADHNGEQPNPSALATPPPPARADPGQPPIVTTPPSQQHASVRAVH